MDPGPYLQVVGRAAHDPFHMVKVGASAWGIQFHPEFSSSFVRHVIELRRQRLDEEMGPGFADDRLAGVSDTPEGPRLLGRFAELVQPKD